MLEPGARNRFLATVFCLVLCAPLLGASSPLGAQADSRTVDLVVFGDVSYRSTNLFKEDYDFVGGWVENRLSLRKLPLLGRRLRFNPYVKGVLTLGSRAELPEENTYVYGIGVEVRLPSGTYSGRAPAWLTWIAPLRLYGEYLRVRFLRNEAGDWFPRDDWRFGGEVWKELNVDLSAENMNPESLADRLWGELWMDLGWRKTDFLLHKYESWTSAVVLRVGARYPLIDRQRDIFLMPYFSLEACGSQWAFSWQNRAIPMVGLRVMPFLHNRSYWLRRLRMYGEYRWTPFYLCDGPLAGTPDRDIWLGINFSNTLWR